MVASSVEIPIVDDVSLRSVSSCSIVSSSHFHTKYSNCFANADFGVLQMGFHFDREAYNGGMGKITRAYGYQHRAVGGTLTNHRIEIFNPQRARYSADVSLSFKGFPVGTTFWVEAHVGMGDNVWTVHKYSKKG